MEPRRRQPESDGSQASSADTGDREVLLESETQVVDDAHEHTDIRGDRCNIALLFFLYVLQGIPLGLISAVPMLLQNRGVNYKQQAEFSLAQWPFSLKLLWAPIVDSLYIRRFGRRKSWLIPVQYLIGTFMLLLSFSVNGWLGNDGNNAAAPRVFELSISFFVLNFLAATQDIAVDGWALTMLKRCNVGYASTCNSVGQTAGYFLGFVVFVALESAEFCNNVLRSTPKPTGIVTLADFIWFWGLCFIVATTLVAFCKREQDEHTAGRYQQKENALSIGESYKKLVQLVQLRPVLILCSILLTAKIAFAACDSVTSLKLVDAGVPKQNIAMLGIPMIPLQIILPLIVSRYTNGPRPMDVYVKAIPYRLVFASLTVLITYLTPYIITGGVVPLYYYALLLVNYACYQIFLYSMFVAVMAFFAKISDPAVGGTHMTFFNTIANLGGMWPSTVVLWLVDMLTWKKCAYKSNFVGERLVKNTCTDARDKELCTSSGGSCELVIDGYYLESIGCAIFGILWLFVARRWIKYLQNLPNSAWRVDTLRHKQR